MAAYTIKRIRTISDFGRYGQQFNRLAPIMAANHAFKIDVRNFDLVTYSRQNYTWIVVDEGDSVIGALLCRETQAALDPSVTLLYQDMLWAATPRAFKMLMDKFIDIGRSRADHLISMVGVKTNLKESSFVKLGFTKLETLYHLEV